MTGVLAVVLFACVCLLVQAWRRVMALEEALDETSETLAAAGDHSPRTTKMVARNRRLVWGEPEELGRG